MARIPWLLLLSLPALAGPRHEFVSPAFLEQFDPVRRAQTRLVPGAGPLPEAIQRDGARLDAPPDAQGPAGESPVQRTPTYAPDRRTVGPARLGYHAVYNPSVAPWRRDAVLDAVRDDATYQLSIRATPREEVPVGPAAITPGHEPFWGDLVVAPQPGGAPIPSVAPGMRVLALEAQPPVPVRLERDAADNYYVQIDGAAPDRVRLRLLVEVNPAYFGRPVPDHVPLDALADDPHTRLPARVAAAGRAVLARIGVRPEQSYAAGLARLVAWFRGFEEKPFEGSPDDLYRDLALGRVGVCRHRAFAFFITARAAGVPTRYVQNEAHAFVEVRAPDGLWRRVDLGGGAAQVDVQDGADHRQHVPPADPFPAADGTPAPGESAGMTVAGLDTPLDRDAPAEGGGAAGSTPINAPDTVPLPRTVASLPADRPPPGRTVQVALDAQAAQAVFRGEALPVAVQGQVRGAGAPVADRRVQIYLVPEGGGAPVLVGAPVRTDARGRFSVRVSVPRAVSPGRYTLVAASEAGAGWAAGRSDVQVSPR